MFYKAEVKLMRGFQKRLIFAIIWGFNEIQVNERQNIIRIWRWLMPVMAMLIVAVSCGVEALAESSSASYKAVDFVTSQSELSKSPSYGLSDSLDYSGGSARSVNYQESSLDSAVYAGEVSAEAPVLPVVIPVDGGGGSVDTAGSAGSAGSAPTTTSTGIESVSPAVDIVFPDSSFLSTPKDVPSMSISPSVSFTPPEVSLDNPLSLVVAAGVQKEISKSKSVPAKITGPKDLAARTAAISSSKSKSLKTTKKLHQNVSLKKQVSDIENGIIKFISPGSDCDNFGCLTEDVLHGAADTVWYCKVYTFGGFTLEWDCQSPQMAWLLIPVFLPFVLPVGDWMGDWGRGSLEMGSGKRKVKSEKSKVKRAK